MNRVKGPTGVRFFWLQMISVWFSSSNVKSQTHYLDTTPKGNDILMCRFVANPGVHHRAGAVRLRSLCVTHQKLH